MSLQIRPFSENWAENCCNIRDSWNVSLAFGGYEILLVRGRQSQSLSDGVIQTFIPLRINHHNLPWNNYSSHPFVCCFKDLCGIYQQNNPDERGGERNKLCIMSSTEYYEPRSSSCYQNNVISRSRWSVPARSDGSIINIRWPRYLVRIRQSMSNVFRNCSIIFDPPRNSEELLVLSARVLTQGISSYSVAWCSQVTKSTSNSKKKTEGCKSRDKSYFTDSRCADKESIRLEQMHVNEKESSSTEVRPFDVRKILNVLIQPFIALEAPCHICRKWT